MPNGITSFISHYYWWLNITLNSQFSILKSAHPVVAGAGVGVVALVAGGAEGFDTVVQFNIVLDHKI